MSNRLKLLREELGLSQIDLASKLNVSSAAISKIEKGHRNLTKRMIIQICTIFGVNKEWLETGDGNIFIDSDSNLAELMGKVFADNDEFMKKVFLTFSRLNDSERATIMKIINELSTK